MKIVEINSKDRLNTFVAKQKITQFLQSWQWGDFQKELGFEIKRIGVADDNGELLAATTLVRRNILGSKGYLFCPRGPVLSETAVNEPQLLKILFSAIKEKFQPNKNIFLRIEPTKNIDLSLYNFPFLKTIDIEPKKTLVLNLDKREDALLKEMHQKTRYNIRLAEKKGVVIEKVSSKDFDKFWKLMQETGERDDFGTHTKQYYEKSLGVDFMHLYLAKYQGEIVSAGIFSFFGDTATYVHGASSYQYRHLMAPYLLQWTIVKQAKKDGLKYYDFFGIDKDKWPGVTRFKLGFGGEIIKYPGTIDIIFSKFWYITYQMARKIRRMF